MLICAHSSDVYRRRGSSRRLASQLARSYTKISTNTAAPLDAKPRLLLRFPLHTHPFAGLGTSTNENARRLHARSVHFSTVAWFFRPTAQPPTLGYGLRLPAVAPTLPAAASPNGAARRGAVRSHARHHAQRTIPWRRYRGRRCEYRAVPTDRTKRAGTCCCDLDQMTLRGQIPAPTDFLKFKDTEFYLSKFFGNKSWTFSEFFFR